MEFKRTVQALNQGDASTEDGACLALSSVCGTHQENSPRPSPTAITGDGSDDVEAGLVCLQSSQQGRWDGDYDTARPVVAEVAMAAFRLKAKR
jgi:hypothetical protein